MKKVDNRLFEKLCCPACKGDLQYKDKSSFLCVVCRTKYFIIDGIPNLIYYPGEREGQRNFNSIQAQYERDAHDREAEIYEDTTVKVYGDKTELIATDWAKVFPGPILDYGCGTGQISRALKRYHSSVYAFDISLVSLSKNIQNNNVLAVSANAFHLPFRNKSFETVCCNGVLHHIVDLRFAVAEMARVASRFIAISEQCTVDHYRLLWKTPLLLTRATKVFLQAIGLLGCARRLRQHFRSSRDSEDSKYERTLEPYEIVELLKEVGFTVTMLRFWTNLNWKRRSRIKKILIKMLVSNKAGTHFEIRAERSNYGNNKIEKSK